MDREPISGMANGLVPAQILPKVNLLFSVAYAFRELVDQFLGHLIYRLVQKGQGVFGIAVRPVHDEVRGEIYRLFPEHADGDSDDLAEATGT